MERNTQRGVPSSSSSSSATFPTSSGGAEHRIQIPYDIEAQQPCQQTQQRSSTLLVPPPPSYSSPRRRLHPVSDTNPIDLPPALANNPDNRPVRFRVRRFLRSPRDKCSLYVFLLLFSFFLIWWFSSPAKLAIKDGRTVHYSSTAKPFSLNDTEINLSQTAILAVATSQGPNAQFVRSVNDNADENASPLSSQTVTADVNGQFIMSVTDKADDNASPLSSHPVSADVNGQFIMSVTDNADDNASPLSSQPASADV